MALRRKNVLPLVIESEIERLVPGGSPERLSRIVREDDSSLARIARVALQNLRAPRSENIEAVETRARHEMVILERGLIVLEIITGIAPLLGLIGAVSGLVHVFSPSRPGHGRGRHEGNRPRYRRGAERHRLRFVHRRPDPDRVQLFLEKGRSDVGGNGNAGRGIDQQVLLRAHSGRDAGARRALGADARHGARADAVDLTTRSDLPS